MKFEPIMPTSRGQSHVLFEDGYAEGWAKCNAQWQAAIAEQPMAGMMVDMVPPATSRDRWMYEQGRLAERDPHSALPPKAEPAPQGVQPIDMVLFCPNCGKQHVDAPEGQFYPGHTADESVEQNKAFGMWDNPPHRSHLCHDCGTIWRPADVPTNGVQAITTQGKADTWIGKAAFASPAEASKPVQAEAPTASNAERARIDLSQWEKARFGYFDQAGLFVEFSGEDNELPNDSSPRWVGGLHDMQLLRAALATQQEAQPQAEPFARIEFRRGTPGKENDMPTVVSCDWLPDGIYEVYLADPTGVEPCCGEYAQCHRPCTPRGRWLAQAEPAGGDKEDAERYSKGWFAGFDAQEILTRESTALLQKASECIGRFVSDEGWTDQDMQTMDNIDAHLASLAARAAQQATGERG